LAQIAVIIAELNMFLKYKNNEIGSFTAFFYKDLQIALFSKITKEIR